MAYSTEMTPITISTFDNATDAFLVPLISKLERSFILKNIFQSYFKGMMGDFVGGTGQVTDGVVKMFNDFSRTAGDRIRVPMGDTTGVTQVINDATLRGNAGKQKLRFTESGVVQRRFAVDVVGEAANQRLKGLDLVAKAIPQLAREDSVFGDIEAWSGLAEGHGVSLRAGTGLSRIFHEEVHLLGAAVGASLNEAAVDELTDGDASGDIATSNIPTWDGILGLSALGEEKLITPLNINGEMAYVFVTTPFLVNELAAADTNLFKTLHSQGDVRGMNNQLFKKSVAKIGNVFIHQNQRVPGLTGGGAGTVTFDYTGSTASTIRGKMNFLLGRWAVAESIARTKHNVHQDDDFGNANSVGLAMLDGWSRCRFVSHADGSTDIIQQGSIGLVSHPGQRTI